MDLTMICRRYALGRLQAFEALDAGTVSRVWRLDCTGGTYLLRTLKNEEQGQREWEIYTRLTRRGFDRVPRILTADDGVPMAEQEGVWYQVQELLSGTFPDPAQPGMAAAMAETAAALAGALTPDIHGDLGPWNMIVTEKGLYVIDFGAARPGDPQFDYASLLGGVINHTPPELRKTVCGEFLRVLDCDRGRLLAQLRLWAEEGAARWRGQPMETRFYHALNWAEENINEL